MRKISWLFIIIVLTSCAQQKLIRINNVSGITGPPQIRSLIDVGSLPPASIGEINQEMTDGFYTPGEWVAVIGDNLASPDTKVYIGGLEVPVAGYLERNSILVRIPRGLMPNITHNVSVKTVFGKADFPLTITSHLIINDPFGARVIFYRSVADKTIFFKEDKFSEVPAAGNYCQAMSPSGGLLYAINAEKQNYQLNAIHLGAKQYPKKISSVSFQSDSEPASMDISPKENLLVVLTEQQLFIFDLSNPGLPVMRGSIYLPLKKEIKGSAYKSVALMRDGKYAAAVSPSENSITLIDISDLSPRIIQTLEIPADAALPLSIDICADRDDQASLWLMQGPNLRFAYEGLKQLLPSNDNTKKSISKDLVLKNKLINLKIKNDLLEISGNNQLPDGFIPLYMKSVSGNKALISGISIEFFKFVSPDLSIDGVKRFLGWLKDTIAFGRIISITNSGEIATEAQGLSIFLCIDRIAKDGPLVYSIMKIGPRFIPPSVGVDMGIEVFDNQYFYFKKMDMKSLYPPYKTPLVIVQ